MTAIRELLLAHGADARTSSHSRSRRLLCPKNGTQP